MLTLALWGFVILLLLLIVISTGQRRLMYFPHSEVPSPAAVGLANVDTVTFAADDGVTLHGWFLRSRRSPASFTVSLIFNTGAGSEADNRDNDLAVWGAPRLVMR